MKFLTTFFRYFVGSLFIFSGFIKLNDPVGFSFKLEEYFGPTVFDIDFFSLNNLAGLLLDHFLELKSSKNIFLIL